MGLKNSLILMLILNSISLVCQEKPNILWLVCEDQSLFFAPYGDSNAYTPNINQLANEGTVYENCFTVSIGQFGKIINILKENNCKKLFLLGASKNRIFQSLA